jgi:hypothetical protein
MVGPIGTLNQILHNLCNKLQILISTWRLDEYNFIAALPVYEEITNIFAYEDGTGTVFRNVGY